MAATSDIRFKRMQGQHRTLQDAQDELFDKVDSFEAALGLTEAVSRNTEDIAESIGSWTPSSSTESALQAGLRVSSRSKSRQLLRPNPQFSLSQVVRVEWRRVSVGRRGCLDFTTAARRQRKSLPRSHKITSLFLAQARGFIKKEAQRAQRVFLV